VGALAADRQSREKESSEFRCRAGKAEQEGRKKGKQEKREVRKEEFSRLGIDGLFFSSSALRGVRLEVIGVVDMV